MSRMRLRRSPTSGRLNSELDQTQPDRNQPGPGDDGSEHRQSALQSAVTLVEQAETYGAQGASDTSTATTRQDLANELGAILQQLVSTANTTVQGRYIFAGDTDQTTPYSIDLTQSQSGQRLPGLGLHAGNPGPGRHGFPGRPHCTADLRQLQRARQRFHFHYCPDAGAAE